MESMIRQFYEIPGKIISLKSDEYLFHEGDAAKYFYFVRSGQIFIMKYAESGRVLSLRLAKKDSIIGEFPLYEKILYGKKGALYSTLIRLSNSYGEEVDGGILISVPLTNQELANYSATARESLNRMLGELRRNNVIEMRDGLIFIKNIEFLKQEIQCENCGKEICNIE